jgi:dihydrolipoamide dehydrogenase
MSEIIEIRVPDLGGFSAVDVIDVLACAGDSISVEQPLITLETDKATMDVPAPAAGTIVEMLVARGDKVSTGSPIARLALAPVRAAGPVVGTDATAAPAPRERAAEPAIPAATPADARSVPTPVVAPRYDGAVDRRTDLVVIGAGPGGYAAAFRAADLGVRVTLVERWPTLGGVCLNVGCIPSKALLHAAKVVEEAASMAEHGIVFGAPRIDVERLRGWKNGVVRKLTGGLKMLAKQRKVEVVQGEARFVSPKVVAVTAATGVQTIGFEHCIVAAGSEPVRLPFMPDDPRIIDSTGALELESIPGRMLVIGGGIIGLEMACVYAALGTKVSVVELMPQLMPGCDPDLVRPLEKRIRGRYERVLTGVKVTGCEAVAEGLRVRFEGNGAPAEDVFDRVLVAVGRVPNGRRIGAEAAGLEIDPRGFIVVDRQMRTREPHIFAIGDIAGQPMLAHKATHEGKVAAEVVAGHKAFFDARVIPSVAYTDPEVAWVGLTETEAKAKGIAVQKGLFPWMASGRSLAQAREEGFTKLLFDPVTRRVLGGGLVGPSAGELVAEIALAIELGADAADIGLTIHPHPTLSETVAFAAEAFEGTLTDLYVPRKV